MIRFLTVLSIVLYMALVGASQESCGTSRMSPIQDLRTYNLNIEVENAVINNLSNPLQCVQLIEIEFRHDLVGDISLVLISPAGQRVQLMGPIVPFGSTSSTFWDIDFFQCGDDVIPDEGFNAQWDNMQPWGILSSYEGGYWPYDGCLEDFDTGPVNGFWTLEVVDGTMFQEGIIEYFNIIFCNTDNNLCPQECVADAGRFTDMEYTFCEGDPALNLEFAVEYDRGEPDPSLFARSYILTGEEIEPSISDSTDYTLLGPGTYEIYAFSYDIDKRDELLQVFDTNGFDGILAQLEPGNITACAHISDEPAVLVIEPVGSIIRSDYIESCDGTPIEYEGITYTRSGRYQLQPEAGSCETIIELTLVIFNFDVEINAESTELTCENQSITLTASPLDIDYVYRWDTDGGNIRINNQMGQIEVTEPGLYSLSILRGACETVPVELEITQSADFPTVDIEVEQMDCEVEIFRIAAILPEVYSSFRWDGPGVSATTEEIFTSDRVGEYTLTVVNDLGCENSKSVIVDKLRDFIFDAIQPTCDDNNTGTIVFNNVTGGILPVEYSIDGTTFQDDPRFENVNPGDYNLIVRDINLCTLDTTVVSLVSAADFTVNVDSERQVVMGNNVIIASEVVNNGASEIEIVYEWIWQGEVIGKDPIIEYIPNESGILTLIVSTTEGCPLESEIQINMIDSQPPEIYVPNVFLPDSGSINEVFTVFPGSNIAEITFFKIFDRWGNLVYNVENIDLSAETFPVWKGDFKGKLLNPGVFVYMTNVRLITSEEHLLSGTITMIK